ncbi:MAG TPA: hypothetical protein VEK11_18940 [Thermoanaerobaculia bacterium]|nr:hypothetical protein [Thermoanaerobaculia bacterium]
MQQGQAEAVARRIDEPEGKRLLRFLAGGAPVTRADVVAMLRGWQYRSVSDRAFAEWRRNTAPVADVDDWDEESHSLTLHALEYFDAKLNRGEVPLAKNPCVALLRTRVVPLFLQALGPRVLSEERMEELDREMNEIENEMEEAREGCS